MLDSMVEIFSLPYRTVNGPSTSKASHTAPSGLAIRTRIGKVQGTVAQCVSSSLPDLTGSDAYTGSPRCSGPMATSTTTLGPTSTTSASPPTVKYFMPLRRSPLDLRRSMLPPYRRRSSRVKKSTSACRLNPMRSAASAGIVGNSTCWTLVVFLLDFWANAGPASRRQTAPRRKERIMGSGLPHESAPEVDVAHDLCHALS